MNHKGWIRDTPDQRDHLFAAPSVKLPALVDLRSKMPPVYDQGPLGSCTGNAIASAIQFARRKQKLTPDFIPSRLFIYYNERAMEGTINSDSGASIRDGIKSIAQQGVCAETKWPYIISKFKRKPTDACYTDALKYRAVSYARVTQTVTQMRSCLASGYPFVFGFAVYDSFETDAVANSGVVPMPQPDESVLGGHAVLAVGYDDKSQRFIARNSWGNGWGQSGYFTIPYAYVSSPDLSADLWTVRVESA